MERGLGGGAAQIVATVVLCLVAATSFIARDVFEGVVSLGCAVLLVTMWSDTRARIAAAGALCLFVLGTLIGNASNGAFQGA